MFAYCPGVDQKKCGIISDGRDHHNFDLHASETEQGVSTTEMHYKEGPVSVREYDACHYMIKNGLLGGHRRL